jgi:hypothetical protein
MTMTLTAQTYDRLSLWRFTEAQHYLGKDEGTDYERQVIALLSRLLGDSAMFDGDLGILIDIAVMTLMPDPGPDDDDCSDASMPRGNLD